MAVKHLKWVLAFGLRFSAESVRAFNTTESSHRPWKCSAVLVTALVTSQVGITSMYLDLGNTGNEDGFKGEGVPV